MTSKLNSIEAVAIDIDGTLLTSKHQLSKRVEDAIKAVIAQGIHVILATGKTRNSGEGLIERLGIKSPGIYLQGLAVYDTAGKVIYQQTLNETIARQVITFMDERGFNIIAYNGTRILTKSHSTAADDATTKYHEPKPEPVGPLQNIVGDVPIHKLMAIGEPKAINALRWNLNLQLGKQARLVQAGVPTMLEVLPPAGGKANALRWVLKELSIKPERVLAIGDAENDMEMLELAGIGVAMGNAQQKVKDVANHVVGTNDEDGVAEALERFVLATKTAEPVAASNSTEVKSS